ncbi:MAG TPA: hypothetical protein VFI49_16575 [Rudaea sp.]|nr:hypothetical protein [Rudaea sp.]
MATRVFLACGDIRRCAFFAGTGLLLDCAVFVCAPSLLFFAALVLPAGRVDARVPVVVVAACGRRFGAALRFAVLPTVPRRAVVAAFFALAFFALAFFAGFLRAAAFLPERFAVVAIICSCC